MKGLGAEGDDVSEDVLAVDAMVSAWCGWCRGGGGRDQEVRDTGRSAGWNCGMDPAPTRAPRDAPGGVDDVNREPSHASFVVLSEDGCACLLLLLLTRQINVVLYLPELPEYSIHLPVPDARRLRALGRADALYGSQGGREGGGGWLRRRGDPGQCAGCSLS